MRRRWLLKSASSIGIVGLAGCSRGGRDTGTETNSQTAQLTRGATEQPSTPSPATKPEEESTSSPTQILDIPWTQLPGPPGGPVTDIAVSSVNDDKLYVTSRTAGLYSTADGGDNWIQGPEANHHKWRITVNPHDPDVARTKYTRTVDGGRTWFTGAYKPERLQVPSDGKITEIGMIEYDPFIEGTLYAGTAEGFYRTEDGGENWEFVEIVPFDDVSWVDTARGQEGVVFAASFDDTAVVKSEDYGISWEVIVESDEISGSPVRGLAVEQSGGAGYLAVANQGVFRFGDGNPQLVGPDIPSPHFLYYDGPTLSSDDKHLYYHAFSLDRIEQPNIWEDMRLYQYDHSSGETQTVDMPEKPAAVTAHPTEPATVFFGGWSWVWKSRDRGNTWSSLDNNFVDRYLSAVGTNPTRPGTVIPGSVCSSGLWTSHDLGETYSWKRSGLDPFHQGEFNEHYINRIEGLDDRIYATSQAGLLYSTDNGENWNLLRNEFSGQGDVRTREGSKNLDGLGVSPDDPRVVYVGTGITGPDNNVNNYFDEAFIWKTSDGGSSWKELTSGFPTRETTAIQDILVSAHDTEVIYVGTGTVEGTGIALGIYRSTNGGSRWDQLRSPFANVDSVTQDAKDESLLYASTPNGVYRSDDEGDSWKNVLSYEAKGLLAHPEESGVVFAGVQKYENYWDLLVSTDGGEAWSEGNLTIQVGREPNERAYDGIHQNAHYMPDKGQVRDLAIDAQSSHLVVATRGAGLWRGDVSSLLN